jgi:nucleoside-diphosphate-sugar epimerase
LKVLITNSTKPLRPAIIQELKAEHQVYLMGTGSDETDIEFIPCDILNMDSVQQAVKGMEAIIHLSEMPYDNGMNAEDREQRELDYVTRGTYYLMQAAVSEGIQRFVYGSSLSLFDSCPESWVATETWMPRPKAEGKPMAKYLGELVCREFARESDVIVVCLRLGKVVYAEEVLGKPFDPMWVDVRDAARAFSLALKANVQRALLNVFHISSDNPDARFPVSKAKKGLAYQPEHDFREVSQ